MSDLADVNMENTPPTLHCTAAYSETNPEKLLSFIEGTVLGSIITSTPSEGILVNQIPFTLHRSADLPHNSRCESIKSEGGDRPVCPPTSFGTLHCHFPRQNEAQLKAIMENPTQQIVIVFNGANHYISANWFPSKQITHKFVPTWNYATVNVTARVRRITESGPTFMKDVAAYDASRCEHEKDSRIATEEESPTPALERNFAHRAFLREHLTQLSAVCEAMVGEDKPWLLSDAPVSFLDGLYTQLVGVELDILRIDGKIKAVQNKVSETGGVVAGLQRLIDESGSRYKNNTNASAMCPLSTLKLAQDGGLKIARVSEKNTDAMAKKKAADTQSRSINSFPRNLSNPALLWGLIVALASLLVASLRFD